LSFDYGQRHIKELEHAKKIIEKIGSSKIEHRIIQIPSGIFAGNYLVNSEEKEQPDNPSVEDVVVPGRNLVFISLAIACTAADEINYIFIGCCLNDVSGFPDCKPDFLKAMKRTARALSGINLLYPCLNLSKMKIKESIKTFGYDNSFIDSTWSCYTGNEEPCGVCPACVSRDMT
jgi:7-cyano-7-deazaguanine synthase